MTIRETRGLMKENFFDHAMDIWADTLQNDNLVHSDESV